MGNEKRKIFFYSGTHWDREWYQTFQGFRKRLVDAIDGLMDELETNERYGIFHMDGQTIVLEDYLQIMPDQKDRLTKLIQDGKILIGPWYDMPDEFLVSGESLIRNLRRGMKICRSYGVEPCSNAYICDIFGHSSQTPQIFNGMNLHHTILGRGLNDHCDPSNFRWEALDGSQVITFKLPDDGGYGDFNPFTQKYPSSLPAEELDAAMKEYIDREFERTGASYILIMDAVDHQLIRKDTPKYLDSIRRVYPDAELYHCSIEEYQKCQDADHESLPILKGELCRPAKIKAGYIHVITNTLSSRYYLKQYNDRNQTKLEKWVAPLYAFKKTKMATGYIDLAEKYLLQNHPHDSICGCSIDQVHRDMMYRFDQTAEICDEILRPFISKLQGDLTAEALSPAEEREGFRLRIYDPLPYRKKRNIVAKVDLSKIPAYREPFGYEDVPAFKIYDTNENEIPYGFVKHLGKRIFEITFDAELTPAGVTEFYLKPFNVPTRYPERLLTSALSAKGDYVSISVNREGTVDLCDLTTGEVYKNLLTLIDNCDIGDGWYTCAPMLDTLITPTEAEVSIIENSAVRTTFRIVQKMKLPREVIFEEARRRSDETVDFRVTHDVTLAKSDKGITVHTYIRNNACDHRLRLRLPTVVEGETYEAAQSFGYVSRTCGDDKTTADWKEYGHVERNMAGICAKRNGKRGLGFISASGLHECGVWQNGDMDITLFRAVGRTPNGEREPEGQLLRDLDFTYRIVPFRDTDNFASLQKEQDLLATGLISATVPGGKAQLYPSALTVEGDNIVYSTADLLPDGTPSARVFNDSDKKASCTMQLPAFVKKASLVELDGRHIRDLEIKDGKVTFTLPAFRIATVKFN